MKSKIVNQKTKNIEYPVMMQNSVVYGLVVVFTDSHTATCIVADGAWELFETSSDPNIDCVNWVPFLGTIELSGQQHG